MWCTYVCAVETVYQCPSYVHYTCALHTHVCAKEPPDILHTAKQPRRYVTYKCALYMCMRQKRHTRALPDRNGSVVRQGTAEPSKQALLLIVIKPRVLGVENPHIRARVHYYCTVGVLTKDTAFDHCRTLVGHH